MKYSTGDLLRAARTERMRERGRLQLVEATLLAAAARQSAPPSPAPRSRNWVGLLKGFLMLGGVAAILGAASMQPWSTPRSKVAHTLEGKHEVLDAPATMPRIDTTTAVTPLHSAHAVPTQTAVPPKSEAEFLARVRSHLVEGRSDAADHELTTYFMQYPQGHLHLEARVLRVRTNHATSHETAAVQEARALLKAYPNNPYRVELEKFAGTL